MSSVLGRIAAGEADAVDECIDRFGGLVWSIARRFSANPQDAEDAVQDVFLDVWKSAGKYDEKVASEKTFIAMIARRRLIDRLRHSDRRPDLRPLPETTDPASDEHVRLEQGVEAALAAESLKELRPEQRKVIELSIYYGMSHSEIAEATSMPIGTVKSHIWRGLAAVRHSLEERAGGATS